ncbi:hypothetical protein NDU88_005369 [Pleurodeles waltl]|uniref:Uncharacterized protein n=1 Tax=Pleurodeles waltl TaxID=8319 RepID=A0AAV7QFR1_PLEWA|nr:hypothetical protein NDU88_005369 [Pleurodeles waltl]
MSQSGTSPTVPWAGRVRGREKKRCSRPPDWGLCIAPWPRAWGWAGEAEAESVPPGLTMAGRGPKLEE